MPSSTTSCCQQVHAQAGHRRRELTRLSIPMPRANPVQRRLEESRKSHGGPQLHRMWLIAPEFSVVRSTPEAVEIVKPRSRVGRSAIVYARRMSHTERRITVGDRGRLVLPSAVRRELDLKPGTHMLLTPTTTARALRPYRPWRAESRTAPWPPRRVDG